MFKRCIMIFPQFYNHQVIDEIREKYDPLAKHVKPHITLVFPFESKIETNQLKGHISSILSRIVPFEIILSGITPNDSFGRYLFLNIQKGSDRIIELHKRLYTGILKEYYPVWLEEHAYLPHMTVGSFDNQEDFNKATGETKNITESFKTVVNEIGVEIIDENEDSKIEVSIPIKIS